MISFIIPYCTYNEKDPINLSPWIDTDNSRIEMTTIAAIRNINKVHKFKKEIILVDNSNTFPKVSIPNLKVVKGWQYLPISKIKKQKNFKKYKIDNFNTLSMWVSMAYNVGLQHAKGDYIVLQHNDIFYHNSFIFELIHDTIVYDQKYISADAKKLHISTYIQNKELFDKYLKEVKFRPFDGGYVKTRDLYFADCYFFLAKKDFFDDYYVDWKYGDSNHGATLRCLENGWKYEHLEPFHDNPNFSRYRSHKLHTYKYKSQDFITHLKGGFSEHKMTKKEYGPYYYEFMKLFENG